MIDETLEDGTENEEDEAEEELVLKSTLNQPDVDDRYPERDVSEQEALQREYDEEEFQDDIVISDKLIEGIVEKAKAASDKLKLELRGSVVLEIQDTKEAYCFDWSTKDFKFSKDTDKRDCTISLSQRYLYQIAKGRLNPQIAMLSDKVAVTGKASLAVYFFNLVQN